MNGTFCSIANASNSSNYIHLDFYQYHSLDKTFATILAAFFVLIMIGGVVFNVILIYTICRNKALHSIKNYLILNLATCDLLRAVATLPFEPDYLVRGYFNYGTYLCGWKEIIFILSLPSSIINMLLLTSERVFILLYPFQYRRFFTRRNAMIILSFLWLYVIGVATYPIMVSRRAVCATQGRCYLDFSPNFGLFMVFGNFACPMLIVIGMNCAMFCIASAAIERRRNWSSNSNSAHAQFFTNYKAAKTIFVIVANVTLCWFTYICIVAMNFLCRPCFSHHLTYLGKCVNSTSVATNPILYGILNKSIRKFIIKGIRTCARRSTGADRDKGARGTAEMFARLTYLKPEHRGSAANISLTRTSIC